MNGDDNGDSDSSEPEGRFTDLVSSPPSLPIHPRLLLPAAFRLPKQTPSIKNNDWRLVKLFDCRFSFGVREK
ncbi:unnamed protein product [Linum tenue]|uniref:Uncharacterized protein n=1 Tax=Linum tenue TaxID=586396 RepID=A0AAV0K5E5_9ROSI|nr:unnamed protein product [Linum tenue]